MQAHPGGVELGQRTVVGGGRPVEDGQLLGRGEHPRAHGADGPLRKRQAGEGGYREPSGFVGGEQHVGQGDDALVAAREPDPDVGVRVDFGLPLQTQPIAEDDPEGVAPFGAITRWHPDDHRHRIVCTVQR